MYMKKWVKNLTDNPFRNRIFPHIKANVSVKLGDVMDIFDKMRKRTLILEDNDAVRICLLVLLQQGFLGHQLLHNVSDDMLKLVEHLSNCWNIFPWGSYIWEYTYSQLRDALHKRKVLHDTKREKGEKIQYMMIGFVWTFMPTKKILRALAWELRIPFSWSRCCTLFVGDQLAPPLEILTPTKVESETDWWKASLEYFEGKHVQSEVVSEPLEIEKDGISEKKRKRGSSQSSLQDPTYDQLMTKVTKLEGIVATLIETVSSLYGTIGTLESQLLALEVWNELQFIRMETSHKPNFELPDLRKIKSGKLMSMVSVVDAVRATIDGTNPRYPRWDKISQLEFRTSFFPINLDNKHWVAASWNLDDYQLTIYDSLESESNYDKIKTLLKQWKDFIKKDLENMDWFVKTKHDPTCFKISLKYMKDMPQQSFKYGTLDCSVMTCKFIEMFTKGKTINIKNFGDNVAEKCQEFRAKMELMLYETRRERHVKNHFFMF
ncbi:phospholipase-like protein [Tanacetum coccineum]